MVPCLNKSVATLNSIFSAVQTVLIQRLFTAGNSVFFAFKADDTLEYPTGDNFVVITPDKMDVKEKAWQGQGNKAYLWRWYFTITLFTRLAIDESNRDDSFLLDPTLGALNLTDSIIDTLQNYQVTLDGSTFGFELDKITWQKTQRGQVGYGTSVMDWYTDLSSRTV